MHQSSLGQCFWSVRMKYALLMLLVSAAEYTLSRTSIGGFLSLVRIHAFPETCKTNTLVLSTSHSLTAHCIDGEQPGVAWGLWTVSPWLENISISTVNKAIRLLLLPPFSMLYFVDKKLITCQKICLGITFLSPAHARRLGFHGPLSTTVVIVRNNFWVGRYC